MKMNNETNRIDNDKRIPKIIIFVNFFKNLIELAMNNE